MVFDTHVHTKFSFDSQANVDDMAKKAESQSIGIIITEHYDYDMAHGLDAAAYMKEYAPKRSGVLLLGLEAGLSQINTPFNEKLIKSQPFDFVLGSLHMTDNKDIYCEYRKEPPGIDPGRYLAANLEALFFNDIDALGHIDYPCRVGLKKEILYDDYKTQYDELFKALVKKGVLLEINTRRFSEIRNWDNTRKIYKRYYELGGRHVTLGSDAHWAETVGKCFDIALNIIKEAGLKPACFKNRKMQE